MEPRRILQLILAVIAGLTITVTIVIGDNDKTERHNLSPKAERVLDKIEKKGLADTRGDSAKDETPEGTPLEDAEKAENLEALSQVRAVATTTIPDEQTLASVGEVGCRSMFLGTNFSSRNGSRPALLVAHYTVSPNLVGWGDALGIRSFFNRSSTQASSNYVIDREANCLYIVRESHKAWTQGAMNPWSISIEFISRGASEPFTEAQWRKGAAVFAASAKRWGIPIRRGSAPGCSVVRSGIVDHNMLGCGNNHFDISPFPVSKLVRYAREAASGRSALRNKDVKAIHRRCFHRNRKLHAKRLVVRRKNARFARRWRREIVSRVHHSRGARHSALVQALPGRSCR